MPLFYFHTAHQYDFLWCYFNCCCYVDEIKNVSVYGFHYTMLLVWFIICGCCFFSFVPLPGNECLSIYNFPSIIKQTPNTQNINRKKKLNKWKRWKRYTAFSPGTSTQRKVSFLRFPCASSSPPRPIYSVPANQFKFQFDRRRNVRSLDTAPHNFNFQSTRSSWCWYLTIARLLKC